MDKREIAVNGSQNQKIINNVQSISSQGSLLNCVLGVLACLRAYVLVCSRICHAYVFTSLAYLRAWRTSVIGVLACLCAYVLGVLVCVRVCLLL